MSDIADKLSIAEHVQAILAQLGEDTTREGLVKTPARVEKAFRFLLQGES